MSKIDGGRVGGLPTVRGIVGGTDRGGVAGPGEGGGVSTVGSGGLLAGASMQVLQTALEAEKNEHLGYENGQGLGHARLNAHSGTSPSRPAVVVQACRCGRVVRVTAMVHLAPCRAAHSCS